MPVEIEMEGRSFYEIQQDNRRQRSLRSFLSTVWNALSWLPRTDGDLAEPAILGDVGGLANEDESAIKPLTVDRVAHLVESTVEDMESLDLLLVPVSDGSFPQVQWNRDNIAKLISHCGAAVVNAVSPREKSLLHESVICNALDCAQNIFSYASKQQIPVVLSWGEGEDLLGWALDQERKSVAKFVVERILNRCSTPMESAWIIRRHFPDLLKKLPNTMEKLIEDDRFCFEFGRFQVPSSVFKSQNCNAMGTHSTDLFSWKASSSEEVKDFWKRNCYGFEEELDQSSECQVTAVSKFICINCPFHDNPHSVLSQLVSSKASVEMFQSTTIKTLVQWKWFDFSGLQQILCLLLQLLSSALFLLLVIDYDCYDGPSMSAVFIFWIAATALGSLLLSSHAIRIPHHISLFYFLFQSLFWTLCDDFDINRFLLSLHCILLLLGVLQDLRPFKLTGPYITMVYYTIWDIAPFLLLGAVSVITFGAAFLVSILIDVSLFYGDDGGDEAMHDIYHSPLKAFGALFYAMLGTFDEKDYWGSSNLYLTVWRLVLFNVFLLFGTVVLMSLLIAVLGDTFDRLMLSRDAEFIRSRAASTERNSLFLTYWISRLLRFIRCRKERPLQWFDTSLSFLCAQFSTVTRRGRMLAGRRVNQLRKLRNYSAASHSAQWSPSASSPGVLIFHFLVPDESDGDSARPTLWHGRIRTLVRLMQQVFETTFKSLDRPSNNTNEALVEMKQQVETMREQVDETQRKLQQQSDMTQERLERMENRHQQQLAGLREQMNRMETMLQRLAHRQDV